MSDTIKIVRGQVWWLRENSQETEFIQQKSRPWLVVSSDERNQTSPVFSCVPITTRDHIRGDYQVYYKDRERDQVVLCEQITIKAIDEFNDPRNNYMYTVSTRVMNEVSEALMSQLGLKYYIPNKEYLEYLVETLVSEKETILIEKYIENSREIESQVEKVVGLKTESKRIKWDNIMMAKFIKDYENFSEEEISNKYNLTKTTIRQYYNKFKNRIE